MPESNPLERFARKTRELARRFAARWRSPGSLSPKPEGEGGGGGVGLRDRYRHPLEIAIFWTMVVGAVMAGVGAVGINLPLGVLDPWMFGLFGGGLLASTTSIILSNRVNLYRVLYRDISGGSRYDQLRYWTRFKAAGMFLHLLTIVAVLVLAVAVMSRVGLIEIPELPFDPVFRAMVFTGFILVATLAVTHHLALRTPMEDRPRTGVEGAFFYLAVTGSLVFGLAGLALGFFDLDLVLTTVTRADAPFFLLAGASLASAALYAARPIPTLSLLFVDEREFYRGPRYMSRTKSIVLPTMMAFALMFIVIIAILSFGLGVVNLMEEIPQNTLLLGIFGFVIAAMVTSIAVTLLLAREEDQTRVYQERMTVETKKEVVILAVSAIAAAILFSMSVLLASGNPVLGLASHLWLDLAALGIMAVVGPYGFYVHSQERRNRSLEDRFPDFLRDIASSHKAGLTLGTAVKIASRGDYGELTPDVVKMAEQLSWNVPFTEALRRFADRAETPLVRRAVSLIDEADRTGGNVTDVLMAAARDTREIKNLERERRTNMSLYTAVIYITFFVFLAVAAIMFASFIPQIIGAIESVQAVGGQPASAGLQFNLLSIVDYRTFYFMAALVQAVGNGMIAGLIESGKYLSGLKHAFVMVAITVLIFSVLI